MSHSNLFMLKCVDSHRKKIKFLKMKFYIYLIAIVFISSCNHQKKESVNSHLGEQTSAIEVEVLHVSTLIENAEKYNGQEVQIAGTVVHVCKHSGKRMHLLGNDEKTRIRVEAGDIGNFERELEGSEVVTTGVFRMQVIDEEYLSKWESEIKNEGRGNHKSHDEREEEKGKMNRYRQMLKEKEGGRFEQFWVDGISFQTIETEASI